MKKSATYRLSVRASYSESFYAILSHHGLVAIQKRKSRSESIFIKRGPQKESSGHSTYIIYRQEHSQVAQAKHGSPFVWKPVVRSRHNPPRDEVSFQTWLWNLVKNFGPGVYRIVRSQAEGERAGFHPVFYGYVDEGYLEVQRSYSDYKSHPNLPPSRQAFFKIPKKRREMLGV